MRTLLRTTWILIAMLAATPAAFADGAAPPAGAGATTKVDPKAQAKADKLLEVGQTHYRNGEFQEAIKSFTDAYALVHDPVYLFNVAQAYRKIGDCVNASLFYQQYLAEAVDPANHAKVEQFLRELSPCVEQHNRELADARKQADIAAGNNGAGSGAVVQPPVTQHDAKVEVVDRGRGMRIGGIATGGAGVLLLIIGFAEAKHGANLETQVKAACLTSCNWDNPNDPNPQQPVDASGKTANKVAAGTLIGGGIAAIGGVALYYLGLHRTENVTIAPTENGGATASVWWTF